MWFSHVFTNKELEEKTKNLYLTCRENVNKMPLFFEDYFGLSYKLTFGEKEPKKSIYYLLDKYYQNEYYIKETFVNKYLKNNNVVFEYPVGNSRADIVEIQNSIRCYEIKTKYDNLNRLLKQINDYSNVFEYVSVICSEEKYLKIKKIIPNFCGIIIYSDGKNARFREIKKASRSKNFKIVNTLKLFSKRELINNFNTYDIEKILKKSSKKEITIVCKEMLLKKALFH